MARKAFTGDHIKELPKGKAEPYRLWFEFLKLALDMQPEKVNRKFYEPWGDVQNISFNDWFPDNWQRLFAVPASLTLVKSLSEAETFLADGKRVLVRIDRTGPVKRQIEDFKKKFAGHSNVRIVAPEGDNKIRFESVVSDILPINKENKDEQN